MRPWCYRLDGRTPVACDPVDRLLLEQWRARAAAFDAEDRTLDPWRVDWTAVGGGEVSTVFLSVDLAFPVDDAPPLLFESMTFATGTRHDGRTVRYPTWDAAQAGHDQVVMEVRDAVRLRASSS
jgi:hypothetical protein